MPLKRKTRNLPHGNGPEKITELSFFDPVYQNDSTNAGADQSDSDESENGLPRLNLHDENEDESNETLDAFPRHHSLARMATAEDDASSPISTSKIVDRITQIQSSIAQAQTMLDSMEQFKDLVPGSEEQCDKLRVIVANLEEQQAGYVNLLNLITMTEDERSAIIGKMSTADRPSSTITDDPLDDDDEEDENDDEQDDSAPRHTSQSPSRPRIESKIGFTPQATIPTTPTVPPTIHSSDNEQNTRNDNSNYDSLVGSLKSDTLNWKDQQSTSGDEASDAESEKEMERNLMLQKEQLRALQGQKRALLALKRRSEQRLIEQQQLIQKQTVDSEEIPPENDLLSDINTLRDRLKLLRDLYEDKHQNEIHQLNNPSKRTSAPPEHRLQNLHHVRERLDELEQLVSYYQDDLMHQPEEETTVYEETSIQPDDVQRLKQLLIQQKQQTPTTHLPEKDPKQLDQLSNELAAKRLELEQAKFALSRLQEMVEKIEPNDHSLSTQSTPISSSSTAKPTKNINNNNNHHPLNSEPKSNLKKPSSLQQPPASASKVNTSFLSTILSSQPADHQKPMATTNGYVDAKMAAQHREIERLIESRQRLHTIKDQIASLHQSMATPTVPSAKESTNDVRADSSRRARMQSDNLNDSGNYRSGHQSFTRPPEVDDDNDSELYHFEYDSGDGEEIDDDTEEEIPARTKQDNFDAPEGIAAEREPHLSNRSDHHTTELSSQMNEICRCLSTFIQEQKAFNRHMEEHLLAANKPPAPPADPVFNQFQQQVLTQGLIVNLNSAYREIAVLQSEMNSLQAENSRLTSSLSSVNRSNDYSREYSQESLYSSDRLKTGRPSQARSKFDEHIKRSNHLFKTAPATSTFENSSKTSFNSQSTGQQTAIHVNKRSTDATPVRHERNTTFTADDLCSPKPMAARTNYASNQSEALSPRRSPKENLSKSFIIRRRPISNNEENTFLQSQVFHYDPPSAKHTHRQAFQRNVHDDDETSEKERKSRSLPRNTLNIQSPPENGNHDLDSIGVQTLELQVKSIMVQLIPFMRLHINDIFNQSILNQIRERILFLFKQQPDSGQLVRQFHNQFSESLTLVIEKYFGTTVRESAGDFIRDVSEIALDELVKYRIFEYTTQLSTIPSDEQHAPISARHAEDYPSPQGNCVRHLAQQASLADDGDQEQNYQIELAESESRPLMLVGSDEEDNESDQEENKASELETAVSRQESTLLQNDHSASAEVHSNGHEYVLVNRSTSDDVVNHVTPRNEGDAAENDTKNEEDPN